MPAISRADFQNELSRFRRRVPHPDVDKKVQAIGGVIANVTRLAWERSLAHHDSPDEFPLPADPNCQERAFHATFAALPKVHLHRIAKDSAKLLRQPLAARRQVLGDAADLDVKSPLTAVAQAKSRPVPAALKITRADLDAVLAAHRGPIAKPAAAAPTISHARLVAKSIRCIRDSLEPGKDEIVLGGFFDTVAFDLATGELSRPSIIPNSGDFDVQKLGKFKKDSPEVDLGDLEIVNIFLGNAGSDLPLMPIANVFLGEKDLFGFGSRLKLLGDGFDVHFVAPLISIFYVGVAAGSLADLGYFTVASVLTASAWVAAIALAFVALVRILGDDLFNNNQMSLLVDSRQFSFPNGSTLGDVVTLTYRRRVAHYELKVQWQLLP